ncbi:hypothetical protein CAUPRSCDRAFT_13165 [Caulochytrium protostelioides]|uniref:26S proteasome non-ATPase regulatory subunit 3 N-terminal TPR repeats domain-containing protein n=1 Tax=Caulochytrium protostelioides TaxID=1555241 RepID=A0A4P9WSB1_9FUNG|nr:hypothetical protein CAUPRSCDRAFT_13165 [Caulochytrium protostelioides]
MDVDTAAGPNKAEGTDALAAGHADVQSQIEVGAFLALLLVMYLHDKKAYAEGMALSTLLIERIQQSNRRTLDYRAAADHLDRFSARSQVMMVDKAGHHLYMDNPEAFSAAIISVMRRPESCDKPFLQTHEEVEIVKEVN